MNRTGILAFAAAAVAGLTLVGAPSLLSKSNVAAADPAPKSPLDFTVKNIDGKDVPLAKYKGDVVLIVNVASKCGFTPQYNDLEAIYEKYKGQGFKIVAFPANDFAHQEPGTDDEIKKFCTSKFNVKFDMYSKIVVKGEGQAPLYAYLTGKDTDPKFSGDIPWNFTKFLGRSRRQSHRPLPPDRHPDLGSVDRPARSRTARGRAGEDGGEVGFYS